MKLWNMFFGKSKMRRRIIMVLLGQVIMAFGISLLKLTDLGTDPWSAMMLSLARHAGLSYGVFCMIVNACLFIIEILFGRKYIGLGTLANSFLLGYLVDFWSMIFKPVTLPTELWIRLAVCVVSVVILAFSLSLYQSADIGSSPYDALPLIFNDYFRIPFFAGRVLADGFSTLIAFLTGGVIGVGTLMIFLCTGPIANFFNIHISKKLLS